MSCRRRKQRGPDENDDSVFLDLLPVAQDLETQKQQSVFKMMGAEREIRRQHRETAKQFRDTAKRAKRRAVNWRERDFRKQFLKRVLQSVDSTMEKALDTQQLRAHAIKTVEDLIAEAIKHGKQKELSERTRVEWFRVVGYLFQVLRSVMHEYDTGQIQEDLKRLKKLVYNELRKRAGKKGAKGA